MALVRTNITLPAETLALVDEVAGPRGRSAYIAEVVAKQARRDHARKLWRSTAGFMVDTPGWLGPDEALDLARELRRGWEPGTQRPGSRP